jgi:hypothetical protein
MIRHVSIPARNPVHVARVLAELMGGRAYPFPGAVRNGFMAVSGDSAGSMIEVYPDDIVGRPGADGGPGEFAPDAAADADRPRFWPFHVLLSVPLDEAAILRIGAREGWATRRFGRGHPGQKPVFEVIEMWVENSVLFELAPPDLVADYERTFQPAFLDAAFSAV